MSSLFDLPADRGGPLDRMDPDREYVAIGPAVGSKKFGDPMRVRVIGVYQHGYLVEHLDGRKPVTQPPLIHFNAVRLWRLA